MAEAILTLADALNSANSGQTIAPVSAQLHASMTLATNTLALQRAMKAAKAKLQAQGLRVSQFSHRDLVIRADQYLAAHRAELIAEAEAIVDHWRAAGVFGKRGGIHFTRRAELNIFDQRRKA
jgi:hypothetical protein